MSQYVRRSSPVRIGSDRLPAASAPAAPETLTGRARDIWVDLWTCPVAAAWTPSDHVLIATLARLVERSEGDCTPQVAGQIANISASLALSPRGRAVLSIVTDSPPAPRSGRYEILARVGAINGDGPTLHAVDD